MNIEKDDHELEDYFKGESEVSQAYRSGAKEQPSAALDQAIQAAARKVVSTGSNIAFSPFASNWRLPLSLAAVLVVSAGLVFTLHDESGQSLLKQPLKPSMPTRMSDQLDANKPLSTDSADILTDDAKDQLLQPVAPMLEETPTSFATKEAMHEHPPELRSQGSVLKRKVPKQEQAILDLQSEPKEVLDRSDSDLHRLRDEIEQLEMSKSQLEQESMDLKRDLDRNANEKKAILQELTGSLTDKPEQWLAAISDYWQQGQTQIAVEQLRLFLHEFPDYPVTILNEALAPELLQQAH